MSCAMSEILVVPDIHGRDFWKEPCHEWQGQIIFLGDYHDPYGKAVEEPDITESFENLKELVSFVETRRKDNPESIICLEGNHDGAYYTGRLKCRFDYDHAEKVLNLIKQLNPVVTYKIGDILFSHAGVTQDWMDAHKLTIDDLSKLTPSDSDILEEVSFSRGGNYRHGSCTWNDLYDFEYDEHPKGYYQIFGHTWGGRTFPVIEKDFAMLDCKKCFILNTETKKLKEYGIQS